VWLILLIVLEFNFFWVLEFNFFYHEIVVILELILDEVLVNSLQEEFLKSKQYVILLALHLEFRHLQNVIPDETRFFLKSLQNVFLKSLQYFILDEVKSGLFLKSLQYVILDEVQVSGLQVKFLNN